VRRDPLPNGEGTRIVVPVCQGGGIVVGDAEEGAGEKEKKITRKKVNESKK